MKKILFLLHDLHHGGAEKVLVNLVNHMDKSRFDISVLALFGGGVNEQFLSPEVRLLHGHARMIPGNSHIMKLFSPRTLFRHYIKEKYDVIISYLEGPSARIVSGCPSSKTKLLSWIHSTQDNIRQAAQSFRSPVEARRCYARFDHTICVSQNVADHFQSIFSLNPPPEVLYNTVESDVILAKAAERIEPEIFCKEEFKLVGVGKLVQSKGFDRLLRIHKRLLTEDHLPVHTYLLGEGSERKHLEQWIQENNLQRSVTLLGYHTNPYKYVAACDLFVCASHAEGFSTAATEALIVGTPVITTRVSGMEEMLGANGEYGIITENDEEALYQGIRNMLTTPGKLEAYRARARERGGDFCTERTVAAVEEMLERL